jgi:hypothetical protein
MHNYWLLKAMKHSLLLPVGFKVLIKAAAFCIYGFCIILSLNRDYLEQR